VQPPGEVAERLKAAVLKTAERKFRGFESHPLRHKISAYIADMEAKKRAGQRRPARFHPTL
jgi:hypothetical protein